jgi:hypothetical protein
LILNQEGIRFNSISQHAKKSLLFFAPASAAPLHDDTYAHTSNFEYLILNQKSIPWGRSRTGAAEHFAYGHAEGFCLHVNERILDGRDRLLDKAARRLRRALAVRPHRQEASRPQRGQSKRAKSPVTSLVAFGELHTMQLSIGVMLLYIR